MNDMMPVKKSALDGLTDILAELRRWESHIVVALHHGNDTHTMDDVVQMVMAGRLQFFSFEESFTIMEVVVYPQYKVLHCFLAGGKLKGVMKSIEPMSQLAKHLDCKYLSMSGRKGWSKVLAEQGWKSSFAAMHLEIK